MSIYEACKRLFGILLNEHAATGPMVVLLDEVETRPLLLREAYTNTSPDVIAEKHQVSVAMARYRLNASGVLLQVQRARAGRAQRR
jgi:hypothetical protein